MLYSTTTAAKAIGCHRETVRRIAERLNLGSELPTGLAFTAADVARIRKAVKAVGNPKMVAGNKLWRKRKKSNKPRR